MTTGIDSYDAIIHRLQSIDPFVIYGIDPNGVPYPWAQVTGPAIVAELVINPHRLREQIDTISVQVAHWGRLVAQTRRVWQVRERFYRHWRSQQELELFQKLAIDTTDSKGKPKTDYPSQARIEAEYRQMPAYHFFQSQVEEAEEAHNATIAVAEGFKAKRAMLERDVYRAADGSAQRWSI